VKKRCSRPPRHYWSSSAASAQAPQTAAVQDRRTLRIQKPRNMPDGALSPLAAAHAAHRRLAERTENALHFPPAVSVGSATATAERLHVVLLGYTHLPSSEAAAAAKYTGDLLCGGERESEHCEDETTDCDDTRYEIDCGMLADSGEDEDGSDVDAHCGIGSASVGASASANGAIIYRDAGDSRYGDDGGCGGVGRKNRSDQLSRPLVDPAGVFLLLDADVDACVHRTAVDYSHVDAVAGLTKSPKKRPRRRAGGDFAVSGIAGANINGGTTSTGKLSNCMASFVCELRSRCEMVRDELSNAMIGGAKAPSRRDAISAASVVEELLVIESKARANKYERVEDCVAEVRGCISNQESTFVDMLRVVDEQSTFLRAKAEEIYTHVGALEKLRAISVGILSDGKPWLPELPPVDSSVEMICVDGDVEMSDVNAADDETSAFDSTHVPISGVLMDGSGAASLCQGAVEPTSANPDGATREVVDGTGCRHSVNIGSFHLKVEAADTSESPRPPVPGAGDVTPFPFVSRAHALAAQRYSRLAADAAACTSLVHVEAVWKGHGKSRGIVGDEEIAVVSPLLVEYLSALSPASPAVFPSSELPQVSSRPRSTVSAGEASMPTSVVAVRTRSEPIKDSVAALERIRDLRRQVFAAFDPQRGNPVTPQNWLSGGPPTVPLTSFPGPNDSIAAGFPRPNLFAIARDGLNESNNAASADAEYVIRNVPIRYSVAAGDVAGEDAAVSGGENDGLRDVKGTCEGRICSVQGADNAVGGVVARGNGDNESHGEDKGGRKGSKRVAGKESSKEASIGATEGDGATDDNDVVDGDIDFSAGPRIWTKARSVTSLLISLGGFSESSESAVSILTDLTVEFVERIGRSLASCREQLSEGKVLRSPQQELPSGLATADVGYVQARRVRTREETLEFVRVICSSGFRGGFPELQHYALYDIPRTSSELRDVEEKVRTKLTQFAALSGSHLPRTHPSPSPAASVSVMPIEAMGASPRQFPVSPPAVAVESAGSGPTPSANGAREYGMSDPSAPIESRTDIFTATHDAAVKAVPLSEPARVFGLLTPGTRLDILGGIQVPRKLVHKVLGSSGKEGNPIRAERPTLSSLGGDAVMSGDFDVVPGSMDFTPSRLEINRAGLPSGASDPKRHEQIPSGDVQMVDTSVVELK
jgi:hypothetical protein